MHACDLASLKGGVHTRRGRGLAEWVLDMRGVGLVRTTSILRSSAPRAPGIGIQKRREPRRNEGALRRSLDTESKIRWCLVGIVCESRVNALPYPFGSNDQYSAETYMLRITVSLRMRNTQTADRTLFSSVRRGRGRASPAACRRAGGLLYYACRITPAIHRGCSFCDFRRLANATKSIDHASLTYMIDNTIRWSPRLALASLRASHTIREPMFSSPRRTEGRRNTPPRRIVRLSCRHRPRAAAGASVLHTAHHRPVHGIGKASHSGGLLCLC